MLGSCSATWVLVQQPEGGTCTHSLLGGWGCCWSSLAVSGDAAGLEDSWCLQVSTTEVTGVQV